MKILMICIISFSAIFTTGCSSVSTYNPNPEAFRLDSSQIPSVSTNSTVSLTNGQHSDEEVEIGKNGRITWNGNLSLWTDAAINQAERRLRAANVVLDENSQKTLKLAITEAELTYGWVMTRCIVNLEVETGNGDVYNFKGDQRSTSGIFYLPKITMDGAVSRAAVTMVNNPEILRYLNQ